MQFIKFAGLSARQFDLSIGASNGYTLRMKKNNASIGSDVIENILKVYPQLNVVWLITGEGDMLNKGEEDEILDFDQKLTSTQVNQTFLVAPERIGSFEFWLKTAFHSDFIIVKNSTLFWTI